MAGYITFWSKDYVKQLTKAGDRGPFKVVYGGPHLKMPYISSVKAGDIVYPVSIQNKTLAVMARLQVEKVEPAFDYLMRETGRRHSALVPEGFAVVTDGKLGGDFAVFSNGSGYLSPGAPVGYSFKTSLPENIHTVIREEEQPEIPHLFHQEPITCCAKLAASGTGSEIFPRELPLDIVAQLRFGPSPSKEKPLKVDKNGCITVSSLSGFVRKMSVQTQEIFEELFKGSSYDNNPE